MSNENIKKEFGKGSEQAVAVCHSQWRKKHGEKAPQMIQLKHFTVPILESATIDDGFMIAGVAISETITSNGHKFIAEELRPAAEGMVGIPLLKDHDNMVDSIVGKVVNASFDDLNKHIPFKARVNDEKMKSLIQRGDLNSVSIGAMVRELEETKEGDLIARGIIIKELSLVAVPADPTATFDVVLKEAYQSSDNISIEVKKEEDKKMSEEEKTEVPQAEEPKKEENVEAKLLKKELVEANKKLAEFEAEKRLLLEKEYKSICEKKKVNALETSTVDNSTLELLKSQVSEMADVDEEKTEPKEEEKPESKEETESEEETEEVAEEKGYTATFEKSANHWTYLGNYPKPQYVRPLSIVG